MHDNSPMVAIVDFGLGNLFSVERAIRKVGGTPIITDSPDTIVSSDRIVFPGVGAFQDGMKGLEKRNLIPILKRVVQKGIPILGICLGMQLFMDECEEFGTCRGIGLIKGKVVRFQEPTPNGSFFKIPHVGWDSLHYPYTTEDRKHFTNTAGKDFWKGTILENLKEGAFGYFVHSYIVVPDNENYILAKTQYGNDSFCCVIAKDNIMGCQFHPEISGEMGLSIYRNFIFKN